MNLYKFVNESVTCKLWEPLVVPAAPKEWQHFQVGGAAV